MTMRRCLLATLCILTVSACQAQPAERLEPVVVDSFPHDAGAYTQGLLLHEGSLYESTGLYGDSTLREVEIETGNVLRQIELADAYFGEGLARVGDRLIQLTWEENTAFVYDLETLERVDTYTYEGEGWGLCHDGERLYMSNGSDVLTVRDADTFGVTDEIAVTLNGQAVNLLNELECARGSIYANIYTTDFIVRIDPRNGRVTAVIDASGLLSAAERAGLAQGEVLNGIAYNPDSGTFYLTGKHWPRLFEVRLE